ncbi:hypothetical protein E2I00_011624 [Balaenoptera physalus]|uniref:Uncharacterized protein n=1 Tax=Balaenoptera physalus TaxID=9770 RepID=A0A643CJM5_BALPH|nr:hypothetical protein E2I00_011624 [Balaenoptera physalus]
MVGFSEDECYPSLDEPQNHEENKLIAGTRSRERSRGLENGRGTSGHRRSEEEFALSDWRGREQNCDLDQGGPFLCNAGLKQLDSAFSATREVTSFTTVSSPQRRAGSRKPLISWVILSSPVCRPSPTQASFAQLICYVFLGQLLWHPVHPESSGIPFPESLAGSPPTIIPLRECGLEIKPRRAASYCHLTQSLTALA